MTTKSLFIVLLAIICCANMSLYAQTISTATMEAEFERKFQSAVEAGKDLKIAASFTDEAAKDLKPKIEKYEKLFGSRNIAEASARTELARQFDRVKKRIRGFSSAYMKYSEQLDEINKVLGRLMPKDVDDYDASARLQSVGSATAKFTNLMKQTSSSASLDPEMKQLIEKANQLLNQ